MPYKRHPIDYCTGTWPDGPFAAGSSDSGDGATAGPGELAAVTAVAAAVAAIIKRRTARRWSRALLARQAGIGAHTVGKIEAGRAWPDLATIARLARALNLHLTLAPAPAPAPAQAAPTAATPERPSSAGAVGPAAPALEVDLHGLAEPTAAHVIEAILHNSPRMRGQVETLMRQRAARQR